MYTSLFWWWIYAHFPTHERSSEEGGVSTTPVFATVVRYYVALRGVTFQDLATAFHWPEEEVETMIASLEQPEYTQHCIQVCCYLRIPHRLRDTALQRAGYHLDISQLPPINEETAKAFANRSEILTPPQAAQLRIYCRDHYFPGDCEPLNDDTIRVYEHTLEAFHEVFPPGRKASWKKRDQYFPRDFNFRPCMEALDSWIHHLEYDIRRAIGERRDQLLFFAHSFCQLGTYMRKVLDDPTWPGLDLPIVLQYQTKALQLAQQLGNTSLIIETLLERAQTFYMLQHYTFVIQDLEHALALMKMMRSVFGWEDEHLFLAINIFPIRHLAEQSTGALASKLFTLFERAAAITQMRLRFMSNSLPPFASPALDDEAAEKEFSLRSTRRKEIWSLHKESEARVQQLTGAYRNRQSFFLDAHDTIARVLGPGQLLPAIDILLFGLKHRQHEVRTKAALMLGELKHPEAVEPLIRVLRDANSIVQSSAACALGQIQDKRAVKPLMALLSPSKKRRKQRLIEEGVRASAAEALGMLKDSRAVAPLIEILLDSGKMSEQQNTVSPSSTEPEILMAWQTEGEEQVRQKAAEALGRIGDDRAIKPLCSVLDETNRMVEQALSALWRIGSVQALPRLIAAFDQISSSQEMLLTETIVGLVDNRNSQQGIPLLLAALSHESRNIRVGAARVLGTLRESGAVPAFLELLNDVDAQLRSLAAWALGEIADPHTAEALIFHLEDDSSDVRVHCAAALGAIGDRSAIDALIAHLEDADEQVQEQVIISLGQLRDQRALQPLSRTYGRKQNRALGLTILYALCQLRDPRVCKRLLAMLNNTEEPGKRRRVMQALGELAMPLTVKPLIESLYEEKSLSVCQACLRAVTNIKSTETTKALVDFLLSVARSQKYVRLPYEDKPRLLVACIDALKELGDPVVIDALLCLPYTHAWREELVVEHTAEALAVFSDPRIHALFLDYLTAQVIFKRGDRLSPVQIHWPTVSAMVVALGKRGDVSALPVLKQLLLFTAAEDLLSHEQREKCRNWEIDQKGIAAIEQITGMPVNVTHLQKWSWIYAEASLSF